jgi:hypothetical protein
MFIKPRSIHILMKKCIKHISFHTFSDPNGVMQLRQKYTHNKYLNHSNAFSVYFYRRILSASLAGQEYHAVLPVSERSFPF